MLVPSLPLSSGGPLSFDKQQLPCFLWGKLISPSISECFTSLGGDLENQLLATLVFDSATDCIIESNSDTGEVFL